MKDAIIVLLLFGCLIAGMFFAGLVYWAWFSICIAALLLMFELIAKAKTGHTLSQRVWVYRGQHPVLGWVFILSLGLSFLFLLIHLAWKTIDPVGGGSW